MTTAGGGACRGSCQLQRARGALRQRAHLQACARAYVQEKKKVWEEKAASAKAVPPPDYSFANAGKQRRGAASLRCAAVAAGLQRLV